MNVLLFDSELLCSDSKFVTRMRNVIVSVIAFAILSSWADILPAQPAKGYDVHYYNANVRLERTEDSLWGDVTMRATADSNISQILQFAKYLTIDSVFVNNQRASILPSDTTPGAYFVLAPISISAGSQFTVETFYHGAPKPEQYVPLPGQGWGGVTVEDTMMFAMGVGFYAPYTGCTRHWLPCYDLPDDKADSVDLTFTTPPGDLTASNGTLVSNLLTPDNGIHHGERIMHWHEGRPIATYLLTFATGPYTVQHIPNSLGIPFDVYALASDSIKAWNEMTERVSPILAFYDSLFGAYPFEKVGFVVTPFGSMEHQTMISLDPVAISGNPLTDVNDNSTIAVHELSHQWWGDRVTCNTFDDAWLNEGFAHYSESLDLERLFGRPAYLTRQHENISGAKASDLPLSGAPTADNHKSNYPYSTIYQKGAAVLGMLRQYLGDSHFFSAVRYYGNEHAYATATSADLETAFEHISGEDLSWFFREWVYSRGYPTDTVTWAQTAHGAILTFHQRRDTIRSTYYGTIDTSVSPYFRVPVPVHVASRNGPSAEIVVWMDSLQTSTAAAEPGFIPDTVKIDPEGLLLMRTVKVTELAPLKVGRETTTQHLNVYPNPAHSEELLYALGAPVEGSLKFSLYNESGIEVRAWTRTASNDSLSVAGLAAGNYRLVLELSSGTKLTESVSIQP